MEIDLRNSMKLVAKEANPFEFQCFSQSAPLRESHKRSRDGPHQKRSRAIMALSFFNFLGLKKCLCYFNYDNFPIKQNFEISKEQGLRTFVHNMKINR